MRMQLDRARHDCDAATLELERLRDRFHDVEHENETYAVQYQQIEIQSSNLSKLYVASDQLHASVERQTVLTTIQEIVVNLIGSEEVAIFEFAEDRGEFRLASSFGVDLSRLKSFKAGSGQLARDSSAAKCSSTITSQAARTN